MKQYCRYCVHLCVNNVPYCDKHNETRSRSSCTHPNNCKDFEFADCEPEFQDAFGETITLDKVKQARKDIQKYEADCLVFEDRPICLECNEIMFKSIYHILDKLIESEN